MAVDWTGYVLAESMFAWVDWPDFKSLPRRDARRAYDDFMDSREDRMGVLGALLSRNQLAFPETDEQLNAVNDWFLDNVEPDINRIGEIAPRWVSVIHDLRVLLGESQISRLPSFHWELWARKTLSYNQPVVVGPSQNGFRKDVEYFSLLEGAATRQIYRAGSIPPNVSIEFNGSNIDLTRIYRKTAETSTESERGAFVRYLQQPEYR